MSKKISENEIIEKFSELKKIEPEKEWIDLVYQNIVNQEIASNFISPNIFFERIKLLFQNFIFRPVVAVALIVVLVISSITVVWADNQALPGDSLYPIKLAIEEIQGNLIVPSSEKANYQAKLVQERVSEIKKIINSKASSQKKKQGIKIGVAQLQKQLVSVNDQMINSSAVSSVAQKINNAKQELTKVKKEVSKKIGTGDVTKKIDQTVKVVDEIATKALVVSVDENQQLNSQKVSDKIKEVENELFLAIQRVESVHQQIGSSTSANDKMAMTKNKNGTSTNDKIANDENGTNTNNAKNDASVTNDENSLSDQMSMVKIAQSQIKQAKEILEQAKNEVDTDPSSAVNKVLAIKKIIIAINQITDAVLPMGEQNKNGTIAKNGTSTNDKMANDENGTSSKEIINNDDRKNSTGTEDIKKVIDNNSGKDTLASSNVASSTITSSTIDRKLNEKVNGEMIDASSTKMITSSSTNE
ncbi:MAG TPA: hypothetical protein ENL06_01250 [Candidatus Portnoybacteria bacterium]|nr:hypothetical protein [Candidatus Portnoybacteria bacterium]